MLGVLVVMTGLSVLTCLTGLLGHWTVSAAPEVLADPTPRLDPVLALLAGAGGSALAAWLTVTTLSCAVSAIRGLPAPRLTPLLVRRIVVGCLGAGLAAAASPAHAATAPAPALSQAVDPAWAPTEGPVLSAPFGSGLATSTDPAADPRGPDRADTDRADTDRADTGRAGTDPADIEPADIEPGDIGPGGTEPGDPESGDTVRGDGDAGDPAPGDTAPEDPAPEGTAAGAPSDLEVLVVQRGDTLWGIAARDLGPQASDAQIAAAWPDWFEANRDVIGPDPDLIRPGQELRPPA